MLSTDIPAKFNIPFANTGTKNTIPEASQIGITAGAASLTDGFPPLTFTDINSGGVAPDGADFNGILYEITLASRWLMAGGLYPYDATFQTAIGGYPKGAVLVKANDTGLWMSTAENNLTDPDTAGAGWISIADSGFLLATTAAATYLTQTNAASTYETQAHAAATYALLAGSAAQVFNVANGTSGNQAVNYSQMGLLAFLASYAAGNYIVASQLTSLSSLSTLTKLAETKVLRAGTVSTRIMAQRATTSSDALYLWVYVNGAVAGTQRTIINSSTTRTVWNENIAVSANSLVQLYAVSSNTANSISLAQAGIAVMTNNPAEGGHLYTLDKDFY